MDGTGQHSSKEKVARRHGSDPLAALGNFKSRPSLNDSSFGLVFPRPVMDVPDGRTSTLLRAGNTFPALVLKHRPTFTSAASASTSASGTLRSARPFGFRLANASKSRSHQVVDLFPTPHLNPDSDHRQVDKIPSLPHSSTVFHGRASRSTNFVKAGVTVGKQQRDDRLCDCADPH
ncbi:unnamed protein product [Taenia asiatica]|uniref:Uncharacterized protein n=1 Tax=Taenia asiatica TaxID=60517 RepID=A0A0R3VUC8_TAEAS|nr:unnamed protein product [Taenia asiatica]